tara:strand:+ start:539 stop:1273 length:735 start_codon:yes stop_codon:yes gene_type:complete
MSDFATALRRIREHGDGLLGDAAKMLRQLVSDTCQSISAEEGSILIPTDDQTELQFLVSINPDLDPSDITVPVDGSVSGYVYSSRQAIAKVRPETEGASKVDDAAHTETNFLLVVPIVDDDQVYGVATFVNRTGELKDTPFSAEDLMTAQAFGEIYATAMKLFRKIEISTAIAKIEIGEHAEEFDVPGLACESDEGDAVRRFQLPAIISEKAMSLPERECEMLAAMADLLTEYAVAEDGGEYDL